MENSGFDNFECPECHNEGAYFNGSNYECPDCGREWDDHKVLKHGDQYQNDDSDFNNSERMTEFTKKTQRRNPNSLMEKLCSFHGDIEEKYKYLDEVDDWLQKRLEPKTASEIVNEIFAKEKILKPSDFILEDPEQFLNKALCQSEWVNLLKL